jgi:putative tryptophan/tyrosine transport system substrate-binding protein
MLDLRRRQFTRLLGGAAAAWPLAARAQQPGKPPTMGFMGSTTPQVAAQWIAVFVQRPRELGWLEGREVAIQYRWAEGRKGTTKLKRKTSVGVSTEPHLKRSDLSDVA